MEKSYIVNVVEITVCGIVGHVTQDELYTGTGNIPLFRAIARNICLYIMHDHLGYCHRMIAELTGLSVRSVMRNVGKARHFVFSDELYKTYWGMIKETLKL